MQSILWMITAIVWFCLLAVGARELSGHLDTFQVLMLRSLFGLVVVMAIIYWRRQPELFITQRTHRHFWRNIFHFYGQASWFFAIGMIPLAQVFAIEFTVPIWVLVIAAVFLAEPITVRKLLAVGLGMIGVLLIVKPGAGELSAGVIIMLCGAIGFAIGIAFNKKLVATEHPLTIVFYMSLMQLPITALLMGGDWIMPAGWMWVWLFIIGCAGIGAHFCFSKAMQQSEVSNIMALDFLRLPLIALVGMIMYGELFDWWVILGGALMMIGNILGGVGRKQNAV